MGVQNYSNEFKKSAVTKYLNRGNRSGREILEDLGISSSTIFGWVKKYGKTQGMQKKSKRPEDRSGLEKAQLVTTYFSLPEADRGKFLRENGVHSSNLERWKSQLEGGERIFSNRTNEVEANRRIRQLEKELRRKEKALAETAALLVLKKKADSIWGEDEDE